MAETSLSQAAALPADAGVQPSDIARRRSSYKWLVLLFLAMLGWIGLPWLAPIFMQLGWESLAKSLYWIYSFQCHQLPQRSFFLFGSQPMYSLSHVQTVFEDTTTPAILRQFVGNTQLGYKVAWSDRMVSAYSSILAGGIIWFILRGRVRYFPLWRIAILSLPMALDGFAHMMSDLEGIGEGFRFSNVWLAELTQYRLPQSFYAGTTIGTFNSWMRLITGTLFGIGAGWFVFSNLEAALSIPKHVRAQREVGSRTDL